MSKNHSSKRSEKAVQEMAPEVAGRVEELTNSAALLADQEKIRNFKKTLGQLPGDDLPGDFDFFLESDTPSDQGSDKAFKTALDDFFPDDEADASDIAAADIVSHLDDISREDTPADKPFSFGEPDDAGSGDETAFTIGSEEAADSSENTDTPFSFGDSAENQAEISADNVFPFGNDEKVQDDPEIPAWGDAEDDKKKNDLDDIFSGIQDDQTQGGENVFAFGEPSAPNVPESRGDEENFFGVSKDDDEPVSFGEKAPSEEPVSFFGKDDTSDETAVDPIFSGFGEDAAADQKASKPETSVFTFGEDNGNDHSSDATDDDAPWMVPDVPEQKPSAGRIGDNALPVRESRFSTPKSVDDGDDSDDFPGFGKPKPASDDQGFGSLPADPSPFGNMDDLPGMGGFGEKKERRPEIPGYSDDFEDEPNFEEKPIRFGGEEIASFDPDEEHDSGPKTVRSHSSATLDDIMAGDPEDKPAESDREEDTSDEDVLDESEDDGARKPSGLMRMIPFGRRSKKTIITARRTPAVVVNLENDTIEGEPVIIPVASEGAETHVGGDDEMTKKEGEPRKKKKSKLLPVLFGSVAAIILGAFVLDTLQIVDLPLPGQAPPVVIAAAPSAVPALPETLPAPGGDPAGSMTPSFSEPVSSDTPAAAIPAESVDMDVAVAEPATDGSEPLLVPDAEPEPVSVASQVERDRAVAADPSIEDLFDSGTTVTVSEDPRAGVEANVLRIAESLDAQAGEIESITAQMGEFERAMLERDEAMRQRDESIAAALEIAERAESIALAQNEILVRMVETEEEIKRSAEVMQDLSRRIAIVESNDTVTVEVDRLTTEVREQKRDIQAIARSMIASNAELEQRKREIQAAAALAAQRPAPPPSRPVPQGSGVVYGTGSGDVILETPAATAQNPTVPLNAKRGDNVPGYGVIEEISQLEGGDRLIITENGSFVVE